MSNYDVEDIKTLDFPTNVQKRPGMYLGEQAKDKTSPGQKNVAVREILDNSVTEVLKGGATHVELIFEEDGTVIIEDDGRGVPTGVDKDTGQTGIEKCFAVLHSGGNFESSNKRVGPGLNGVGGSCVNAVSSYFKVEVYKKDYTYTEEFSNGLTISPMTKTKNNSKDKHGTRITFKLNNDFFSDVDNIIVDDIIDRMRYTVYVVDNLSFDIIDNTRSSQDGGGEYHFENDGGIEGMLDFISTGEPEVIGKDSDYSKKGIFKISTNAKYKQKVTKVIDGKSTVTEQQNVIPVEVAFRYGSTEKPDIRSFANTIQTFNGGCHEEALKKALMDTFGKMAMKG